MIFFFFFFLYYYSVMPWPSSFLTSKNQFNRDLKTLKAISLQYSKLLDQLSVSSINFYVWRFLQIQYLLLNWNTLAPKIRNSFSILFFLHVSSFSDWIECSQASTSTRTRKPSWEDRTKKISRRVSLEFYNDIEILGFW